MNQLKSLSCLTFLSLCYSLSIAQETTPVVHTWDKNDHREANQIWSASCSEEGVMYFGNANGLLSFDSKEWKIYPINGGNIVRSTYCDGNRIYVGSFEEFGYYEKDKCGELHYTSLSDKLDGYEMKNDEIWTIFKYENLIIFHSFVTIFTYNSDNNNVKCIELESFTENIGLSADGKILCSAYGFSSLDIQSGELDKIAHPWSGRMVACLALDEENTLIVTENEGLFLYNGDGISRWNTDMEQALSSAHINRAALTSDGIIILGSSTLGCCALDLKGHKLWKLNATNVLNSNTVLSICENREGDVFLALDSGIALIDNNSGIRYINSLSANVGAIYCTYYKEPYLYIGSNQGLYAGILKENVLSDVRQFKEIKGPVMYLEEYDSQLFCGSNADSYCIEGRTAQQLSRENSGGSCMAKGIINGEEVLVEGTYTKICLYKKKDKRWVFSHRIDGLIQPIRSIDIDFMGNIWAGHTSRGLYRVKLSEDLREIKDCRYYSSLSKEKAAEKIQVRRIKGRTIFFNSENIYTYDDMTDSIIEYKYLNDRVSNIKNIMDISLFKGERYWVLNEDDAYILDCSEEPEADLRISYNIFNSNTVDLIKNISPGPDGLSIMTLNNSLAFVPEDICLKNTTWQAELQLQSVAISENDGSQFRYLPLDQALCWNYSSSSVKFCYSYPFFGEIGSQHLEYKLIGRDEVWRKCEGEEIDLSHLKEGRYELEVRVVNKSEQELAYIKSKFRIKPPLFRSTGAKILYMVLGLGLILLIALSIKHRIESQRRELENKRLESELKAKSREIASTTMNLLSKNKILSDIKEELSVQKHELGSAYPDKYYRKMVAAIDSQISNEQDWKLFQENFDRIHGNFFQILKSRYPSLTDSDLRFCSFFCMAMSSKEIASMMNISLKGVEAARYRIRKKLQLPSEISLTSFLMDLK